MSKNKAVYRCEACAFESSKWLGRCPECLAWNSFSEELKRDASLKKSTPTSKPENFAQLSAVSAESGLSRFKSGLSEWDRCLGGGWTKGSLLLLGGDPGIGKSTMTLQAIMALLRSHPQEKALYISGEESVNQVRQRALRLTQGECLAVVSERFFLISETDLESIEKNLEETKPQWVVVDSIQTTRSSELESEAGTVSQVRAVALTAMEWSKRRGASVLLIGHVTKEGNIAGPKMLEHMVDTVLTFEGENSTGLRLLRATKNRFGPTNEVGVFEMTQKGLTEVLQPSTVYLSQRTAESKVCGSVLSCVREGTRAFVVEIQALVGNAGYGNGRRTTTGVDANRAILVAAVLEKYLKIRLADRDLFVSTVGGLRLSDPACDLAIAVAILSSALNKPLPVGFAALGEVTLTGEVRGATWLLERSQECFRVGAEMVLTGPESTKEGKAQKNLLRIRTVHDLQSALWGSRGIDESCFSSQPSS